MSIEAYDPEKHGPPPVTHEYLDNRGAPCRGRVEQISDRGGSDITWFMRSEDGVLSCLSGSRIDTIRNIRTGG